MAPAKPGRRQRGQAIVWLLGTLAASAAVLYGVYNVGQITSQKQKVINAADAAALAGATVEARALNLMAYNNRAMIANEVFMVQTVAMEGWFQYLKTDADNMEDYLRWIPYAGPYISRVLTAFSEAAEMAEKVLNKFIPVQVKLLELMKTTYGGLHGAMALSTSIMADQAAADVVTLNKAQFGSHQDLGMQVDERGTVKTMTTAKNWATWKAFTKRYGGNDRTDAKTVLMASRDQFTGGPRPGTWWNDFSLGLIGFEKLGDTQLKGFDRWESEDTHEFWEYGFCKSWKKCYQSIGWGRADLANNTSKGATWSPGRGAQSNARNDSARHGGWSGVPSVYDIADKQVAHRETLGVDYLVAVKRDQNASLTTKTLKVGVATSSMAGSPEMDEKLLGNQLSAIGKARVFFERPQSGIGDNTANALFRHDGAKEYGSLFSPYWQVRLADVSATEKTAYMSALGMNPASAAVLSKVTPGGQ